MYFYFLRKYRKHLSKTCIKSQKLSNKYNFRLHKNFNSVVKKYSNFGDGVIALYTTVLPSFSNISCNVYTQLGILSSNVSSRKSTIKQGKKTSFKEKNPHCAKNLLKTSQNSNSTFFFTTDEILRRRKLFLLDYVFPFL